MNIMWKYIQDNTEAIITAKKHIESAHKHNTLKLPETAVLFFMHGGIEYACKHYRTKLISSNFPTFLNSRPVYEFNGKNACFLRGGWGAPMAADTAEALAASGVKRIVSVGMLGAFGENINCGDIIIPDKAFVEEGTSLHYYDSIEYSQPNDVLFNRALKYFDNAKVNSIVTTDALYRQTFFKEQLWRDKGAVGVDMETSALFSVGDNLKMEVVSILIASDEHPLNENDVQWQWKLTKHERYDFLNRCIEFAIKIL